MQRVHACSRLLERHKAELPPDTTPVTVEFAVRRFAESEAAVDNASPAGAGLRAACPAQVSARLIDERKYLRYQGVTERRRQMPMFTPWHADA